MNICASCNVRHLLDDYNVCQCDLSQAYVDSGFCKMNQCLCENGDESQTGAVGKECPNHGEEKCVRTKNCVTKTGYYGGCDVRGTNIETNDIDAEKCRDMCENDPGCSRWLINYSSKRCYQKNGEISDCNYKLQPSWKVIMTG